MQSLELNDTGHKKKKKQASFLVLDQGQEVYV